MSTWLMGTDKRRSEMLDKLFCLALEVCVCVCMYVCVERRQTARKALRDVLTFS